MKINGVNESEVVVNADGGKQSKLQYRFDGISIDEWQKESEVEEG